MEKGYGISEEIIGRWLAQGERRDRIVLATKVYQPMGTGPNDRRLSAYHIRKACEDSLRRLQTDHIDLYQMHHIDRRTPWEENLDNSAVERALRTVALGRKNYLFAGSDAGGERAAAFYTLLGTAKLNGLDPELYLRHVLERIADHPVNRVHELLPRNLAALPTHLT